MEHGVDHDGAVVRASKQWSTLGEQRENGRAEVAVQRQGHFSCTESHLRSQRSTFEDDIQELAV